MRDSSRFTLCALAVLVGGLVAQPMNVILVMADDVGVEAFGCYGGESYATPRLDRMAREGVRFEHCYSQPLCTPSRVKLMTGLSNVRNYERFSVLPTDQLTFGHLLQRRGYRTAVVGKWQLFAARHYGEFMGRGTLPEHAGFDEHCLWQVDLLGSRYQRALVRTNGINERHGRYGPRLWTDYACDFIRRAKGAPFFLYFPMALPHAPYRPTPDQPGAAGRQARFSAMVSYMDKCIGRLIDAVTAAAIEDRTLVLFTSDNGTGRQIVSRARGVDVRGGKGLPNDRGTHVPLIAWGGRVKGGRVVDALVDFSDFMPTLLDASGGDVPAGIRCDGVSFLPVLMGAATGTRRAVYVWSDPRPGQTTPVRFARDQRWKLYGDGRFFDVARDPDEKRPLPARGPGPAGRARRRLQRVLDGFPDRPQRTRSTPR